MHSLRGDSLLTPVWQSDGIAAQGSGGSHRSQTGGSVARRAGKLLVLALLVSGFGCGSSNETPPPKGLAQVHPERKTKQSQQTRQVRHGGNSVNRSHPSTGTSQTEKSRSQPVERPGQFRVVYPRPNIDESRLRSSGLRRHGSRHFDLITDLPAETAAPLVPLVDQMHPFLEEYFGKLPPSRDGSRYHVTGYVIGERQRFVDAGVMRADLLAAFHGRQIGAEFWMNNQTFDYYRRHLLLHEAVHAFMRHLPGEQQFPLWYLEGMAEMIATHLVDEANGRLQFNVMPVDRARFRGFERIEVIRRDVEKNGVRPFGSITSYVAADFRNDLEPYAWCWALCRFLDSHPRYRKPFRRLARTLSEGRFDEQLEEELGRFGHELETEFALFAQGIGHGYDFERAAMTFGKAVDIPDVGWKFELRSNRGWQSSSIRLERGQTCSITAAGRFTLADDPKPWISEPNGVSIRYFGGQRLGRLMAAIYSEKPQAGTDSMLSPAPLGNQASFTAPVTGILYLRLNDAWNELSDNRGEVQVRIERAESPPRLP